MATASSSSKSSGSPPLGFVPAHAPEVRPAEWVPINRAGFAPWVQSTFRPGGAPAPGAGSGLFPHQRFVRDFLQAGGPNRGLLLYHGLGVGKTAASIAVADALMGEGMRAAVLLPAFLRTNFVSEVMRYGSPLFRPQQRWRFEAYPAAGAAEARKSVEAHEQAMRLPRGHAKAAGGLWLPVDLMPRGQRGSASAATHYDDMAGEQREQLLQQLRTSVEGAYNFVHYNGLRRDSIAQMTRGNTANPFDGCVVVIDEVHNFISRVAGGGVVAPMVYQLLMGARNCKLVALSGTPVINHPHEMAVLANLLRGPLTRHVLRFNTGGAKGPALQPDGLMAALAATPGVDEYALDLDRRAVVFSLLPEGFEFVPGSNRQRVRRAAAATSEAKTVADVTETMRKNRFVLSAAAGAVKREDLDLLPSTRDAFNEQFIDFEAARVRNPEMLARRLQGLVSFFRVYSPELYPRVAEPVVVETPMSTRQFEVYSEVREEERKREERAIRNAQRRRHAAGGSDDVFSDNSNTYRCFSRAVCNFAFPKEVERPYPSKLTHVLDEVDDPDFNEDAAGLADTEAAAEVAGAAAKPAKGAKGAKGGKKGAAAQAQAEQAGGAPGRADNVRAYQAALGRALGALQGGAAQWLAPGGLAALSPKFAAVAERLRSCPGCALVYSTFRNVEGLGVLAMALDAHGWSELRVFRRADTGEWDVEADGAAGALRYMRFTGEREYAQIVLDIYNSEFDRLPERVRAKVLALAGPDKNLRGGVVRAMMITQSGSEGISLRNVRQVHIVEPYWNQVRLDQVMGRAVRAGSHLALPPAERSVESFIYVARFTPEQAHAMRADQSRTSDEFIHGVARRKGAIVESVLGVVRASAVDAQLYSSGAGAAGAAPAGRKAAAKRGAAAGADDILAYPADIARDARDADAAAQAGVKRVVQVTKTLSVATIKGTKYAYDAEEGTLYDYAAAQEQPQRLVPHGRVERVDGGRTRVHMFAGSKEK